MLVSYKWLQSFFDETLPNPEGLCDELNTYAFEIEGLEKKGEDYVINVDVLPNRTSDALCHRGIAKDIATILSIPFKHDPLRKNLPVWGTPTNFSVTITEKELCSRYMAGVIRGVRVGPSPEWLKTSLETLGQKSINNIVDATNYVMLNLGQPIHAFDLSLLKTDKEGNRNITVRQAKEQEQITTLTNDEYTLSANHQLIVDGVSNIPLALAGIKGGKQAEVTTKTVDIAVEVAHFDPVIVRKTANEIKLQTDASLRFQNEPSERLPAFAMRDVVALIEEVAGGVLAGVVDEYERKSENEPIDVTLSEINSMLGLTLSVEEVENILLRYEWEFSYDKNKEEFAVAGPWERTDIHIKEDIIEEIGRMYGYRNIDSKLPPVAESSVKVNKSQYISEKLQNYFVSRGYSEVLTYTIVDKGEVELMNPFTSDKAFMRRDLRGGMYKALELNAQNAPLLRLEDVKLFEIGTVFTKKGEKQHLCVGIKGLLSKQSKADKELEEDVKEVLSDMEVKVVDGVCEIDITNYITLSEQPLDYNNSHAWNTTARFEMWSVYPFVLRDIAVWVPSSVKAEQVAEEIVSEATQLLVQHEQFDEFEKDGRMSYAWHLVFQSKEKTLTDEEIGVIMERITQKLNNNEGWEVR